ncbi:MAG: hypothetical protein WD696_20035 [Bryobacteraceae bacterium]
MSDPLTPYPAQSGNSNVKTALLAGAIIALLGTNVYLYMQIDRLGTELTTVREGLATEVAELRQSSTVTVATHRKNLETLKSDLDAARKQAAAAAGQARTEAVQRAEQLASKLAEEQQKQQLQVASRITEVQEAATTANARIGDVSGDVTNVRSEVAANKSELEKTIADLKKVTGDMGVQSGYIATNGKELAALKRLGERNIIEFKLSKTKQPQRVGDIALLLKKADAKRNRYTVEVLADDKKTEKKDRNINEPVQFYTLKARQPYELVVNQVQKNLIIGYLSTPKEQVARN